MPALHANHSACTLNGGMIRDLDALRLDFEEDVQRWVEVREVCAAGRRRQAANADPLRATEAAPPGAPGPGKGGRVPVLDSRVMY